jgi:hypothetical protein
MVADLSVQEFGSAVTETALAAAPPSPGQSHWDVLGRLEQSSVGRRGPDGAVGVRRSEAAGCFLYGPYMHLPRGYYRLSFRCRSGRPRSSAQPVLGIEIIVLARFQQLWRDFTAIELNGGAGSVEFEVAPEHSLESENEGRFEFRFFHLGNADLEVTAVALDRLEPQVEPARAASDWRLLGRLQKSWLGRRAADGTVRVWRGEPKGCVLYGGWPYLRLPRGAYRLCVQARSGAARDPSRPVLGIEVLGQSRWLSRRWTMHLVRRPETNGVPVASREVAAAELDGGSVALDFAVPTDMAIEAGADAPFDIRLHHLGNAGLTIEAVTLTLLDDMPADIGAAVCAPGVHPLARRKVVIIGNCQSETLRQGFAQIELLNSRFDVRYHFVQLQKNLHEFAARDLETCDILMIQDIRLWDEFPLRDCVRPGADQVRFPLVRFASLWPFDSWNGPGDKQAYEREAPNLTFPYLDGLLGRLRDEIPDPRARFEAYRTLDVPGVINYRRLHEMEVRRLGSMDKRFDFAIGAFILENFRQKRMFHTTVRPTWEVFSLLMQFVARQVGVTEPVSLASGVDASLRNPQVPIHPKIARDLGVRWVDDATRYLNRGIEVTWETYTRSYIEHYG